MEKVISTDNQVLSSKSKLRTELLKTRKNNPAKDNTIFNKLINLKEFINTDIVLSYVSKSGLEIDTRAFIEYCFENKKSIFTPKTFTDEIVFYKINTFGDLQSGTFNVLEPKSYCSSLHDLNMENRAFCLVPALACNLQNHRIGYGRGYYDRFLKHFKGFSVAACYKENVIEFVAEINDISVDFVLTD